MFCTVIVRFGKVLLRTLVYVDLRGEFCGPLKLVLLNCYHFTRNTYLISVRGGVLKAITTDNVALKQKILPGLYSKVEWGKKNP